MMCRTALIFCGLLLSGCGGSSDRVEAVPVSGTVQLNGQPLANAAILFRPNDSKSTAPSSFGKTDGAGKFTLTVATTDQPGAVPGTYSVKITRESAAPSGNSDAGSGGGSADKNALPEQSFVVPKEGTSAANFDLKSK